MYNFVNRYSHFVTYPTMDSVASRIDFLREKIELCSTIDYDYVPLVETAEDVDLYSGEYDAVAIPMVKGLIYDATGLCSDMCYEASITPDEVTLNLVYEWMSDDDGLIYLTDETRFALACIVYDLFKRYTEGEA